MDNEIISLSLLREAEQMAIDGAAKFLAGRDEIAIALHRISTQKLYLAELDEHGLPLYKTFESYWPDIKQKMGGISRSQAYNLLGDAKIAIGPSFNLDYETFAQLGGTIAFEAVKEVAEINQKTGEIIGLKEGYEIPQGYTFASYMIEILKEHAPSEVDELNLNITEYKQTIKDKLTTGEKVELQWFIVEVKSPEGLRCRTKYEWRLVNGNEQTDYKEGYIDDADVPPEIMDMYKKRLPIVGIYKFT